MADLLQSSATTATTTPQYYTDYMTNLAQKGTAGGNAAQYVGATPLQEQAFGSVAQNVGNYQPALTAAGQNYGAAANTAISGAADPYLQAGTQTSGLTQANPYLTAGTSSSADLVGGYMNPYTQNVVDQIRLANQQNIAQNLSPSITSGAVGSGQFGSQRGANALALGISNTNIGALSEQAKALQSGYANSLAAAQQQRLNQLNAGQTAGTLQGQFNTNQVTAGQAAANAAAQQAAAQTTAATGQVNLGQQQQQSGLADVNALSTLGQQQQQIEQNQQLFPLDVAAKQAAILSGAQIPTTVTQTMQGSPLSAIAGLGGLTAGMFTSQPRYDPVTGRVIGTTSPIENIISGVGAAVGSRGTNGGSGSGILGALSGFFPGAGPVPNPGFNTGAPDDYRPPYVGPTTPEDYQAPYVGPTTPGYTPVDNTYVPDYQAPYVGPSIPDYTPVDNTYVPDYQPPYNEPPYVPPNYQLPEYYEDY
jgi:hypothetical protein